MATPIEGLPEWGTNNVVEVIDGKTFSSKVAPPPEVKASGLKYQEPMARSWFNYQFNLIRKWIEELDLRTSGGTTKLGWVLYGDNQYTSGSPLVVTSGTEIDFPNNAATIINSSAPVGASFYNGTKITPDNEGDAYTISVRMMAAASVPDGALDMSFDIGDGITPNVIIGDSRRLVKGAGNFQPITFDFTIFTGATAVANGVQIKFEAVTGDISVYDINFMVQRTYYKDNT